ncbi:hypothetical protein ALC57_05565, partial [Trachymyrmex cornetzi]
RLLRLTPNASILSNKKNIVIDCIKSIQRSICRFLIDKKIDVTNHSIPILNNIVNSHIVTSSVDKKILKLEMETKEFMDAHLNIILTHANKGNVTVGLDKDTYVKKVNEMLEDKETYEIIKKDPTSKLIKILRSLLAKHFLDVTITTIGNQLNFDEKPTFSGRLLNFFSNHPLSQKREVIISLVDRAFLLSNSEDHNKNLTKIIEILLLNDYSLKFIFETINNRIKSIIRRRTVSHNDIEEKDESSVSASWFIVLFIPSLTDKLKKFNIEMTSIFLSIVRTN